MIYHRTLVSIEVYFVEVKELKGKPLRKATKKKISKETF